jgi:hypothetical protein
VTRGLFSEAYDGGTCMSTMSCDSWIPSSPSIPDFSASCSCILPDRLDRGTTLAEVDAWLCQLEGGGRGVGLENGSMVDIGVGGVRGVVSRRTFPELGVKEKL